MTRSVWQEMPFVRVLFALIAGIGIEITCAEAFHVSTLFLWPAIILLLASIAAVIAINRVKNIELLFQLQGWNGLALTALVVSFAYALTWFYTENNYKNHFSNFLQNDKVWQATISEPPVIHANSISAVVEMNEGNNDKNIDKVRGKVLLAFPKDSINKDLTYGDVLLFKAKIEPFDEPKNPGEFNYKRYEGFHNIYYHAYINNNSWKVMERGQGNFLFTFVYRVRAQFLKVIESYVKGENDFAVASALMLGYRDYVNGDVMRAYASSGVVHILSVSGLHVAVMFFILNFFLKRFDNKSGRALIIKAAIVISFIWFYAVLTGMSPPVLRAAIMFTFIQIGGVLSRNKNMYNIVSASAILLLLFDPFFIMDAGFQLSYLAVFGIVFLFPRIYSAFPVNNWLVDKVWGITALSIAAQLVTLPLSLYYFHQFPNLFLLSNLIVIPFSDIILYTGTALFMISPVHFVSDLIGPLFNFELVWLNKFIFWLDTLPFALVKGISTTLFEMVLLYLLLIFGCWLTEERKTKVVLASLIVITCLSSFRSNRIVERRKQKIIAVYDVPKYKAIAFISGSTLQYDFDQPLLDDKNAMQYHIQNHWWSCGVQSEASVDSVSIQLDFGKMVLFEGKRILIVESTPINTMGNQKLKADMVILSHSPKLNLNDLKQVIDFDEVVFDSSNKPKQIANWEEAANKTGTPYWDVKEKGAFIMNL